MTLPMLSRPKNPPPKIFWPLGSFLFTHLQKILFQFDCSSVWAYIASQGTEELITSRKYHDSCEYTYQVKFNKSFWKHRARNKLSRCPLGPDILYTERHAHAWTGGLTSLKANSYAGSWPFGDMYHSRRKRRSWDFANSGSILAIGIMWKARSQEAYYKIINMYKNDKNEETIRWSR